MRYLVLFIMVALTVQPSFQTCIRVAQRLCFYSARGDTNFWNVTLSFKQRQDGVSVTSYIPLQYKQDTYNSREDIQTCVMPEGFPYVCFDDDSVFTAVNSTKVWSMVGLNFKRKESWISRIFRDRYSRRCIHIQPILCFTYIRGREVKEWLMTTVMTRGRVAFTHDIPFRIFSGCQKVARTTACFSEDPLDEPGCSNDRTCGRLKGRWALETNRIDFF